MVAGINALISLQKKILSMQNFQPEACLWSKRAKLNDQKLRQVSDYIEIRETFFPM